jgi:hypothetical protein
MTDGPPVNAREMRAMVGFLQRVVTAESEQERDDALGEGIVAWGKEFINVLTFAVEQDSERWQPIRDVAINRYTAWLGGAELTRRADEDERRAIAALEAAERSPTLARLAVEALQKLPAEHPLRRDRLDSAVALMLEDSEATDDVDTRLMRLASMLDQATSDEQEDALVQEGEGLLPQGSDDGSIRTFRLAASTVFMRRLIEARDGRDDDAVHGLAVRVRQLLDPVIDVLVAQRDSYALTIAGLAHELDDDVGPALELYLQALEGELPERQRMNTLTAVLRAGVLTARHEPVLRFARETLDSLVLLYATEPDPERAMELREDVDRALENVATSCAATGDLDMLLWALEATSSARLRHRMAIRKGRAGPRIRKLEAALWSAERGLGGGPGDRRLVREGRSASSLTAVARLREAHRREAEQHQEALATPSVGDVAARLRHDEGIAVLGTGKWGTAVLLLRAAQAEEPNLPEGEILPKTLSDWSDSLASEDPPGWAYVVGAPWEYDGLPRADRRAALERALDGAEAEVGPKLADWVRRHDLQHLWVVAHGVLGLLPWWAVPSLRGLDVRYVPTLAMLPRARGAAWLGGPTVVVGNATGDLLAADAEASGVAARLRACGLPAAVLPVADNTEDAVTAATTGSRILHFSGHATSEMTDSTRSALHLRPDRRWSAPEIADELQDLVATANWRDSAEGVRTAEVELPAGNGRTRPGLLREEALEGGITLRHLEHSQTGTLHAVYVDGRLVRLAELWSAGDMAVSGALRELRLAVLSACQSGGGGLSIGSDELGGLPAAMMLAGVRSIVCTAWTVDDVLSAVSADLFWELLCSHEDGVVDLYGVVGQVRALLADMPREDAVRRIDGLRSGALAGRTRFLLEAAAARLSPGRPFARPYDWAPLFVLGEPLLAWRKS